MGDGGEELSVTGDCALRKANWGEGELPIVIFDNKEEDGDGGHILLMDTR